MDRRETTRLVLTAIGSAALGAAVYYYVNRYLRDQEEIQLLRLAEQQENLSKVKKVKATQEED